MSEQAIAALLTGSGVAGVWLICVITGLMVPGWAWRKLLDENEELKTALESQTRRADAAVEAVHTTNLILAGLRREARGP